MNIKLELKNVTKKFSATEGVENINLKVQEHELVTLLGPSGCGKTTILRAIGGFNTIDRGEIILDGNDIQSLPPEKRPTGMVFQSYNLWPHMSVFENMAFGLKLKKRPGNEIKESVAQMLELVKMSGLEKKYPAQLSGGQQQRVAIARSLVLKPSILLLDEPFSALDAKIRGEMREELKRIQQEAGLTIIFVTHDQEEAMAISDRIAVMNRGSIEQIDTPGQIYDQPQTRFVASFIGHMNFIDTAQGTLCVRPENVELFAPDINQAQAVICQIMLLGHYAEILMTGSQGDLKCFVTKEKSLMFKIGDTISYRLQRTMNFS